MVAAAVLLRLVAYAVLAQPAGGLAEAMRQFDGGWYERIALAGYGADAEWGNYGSLPHWAFFPLYPLLLGTVTTASSLPPWLAGILLSSACLAGFMAFGAAYLRTPRRSAGAAWRWVVLVALFPYSFFFSALYTEALFALLATLSLLLLARGRPLAGAVAAALASATRPTGVLLAPLFAAHCLRALHRDRSVGTVRPTALALTMLPACVAPLGLLVYMSVQWVAVGDPLAFIHVQALWGRSWRPPGAWLWNGIAVWDWDQLGWLMAKPSRSYFAAWGLLGLAVAAWLAWRRRFAEAWFLGACVLFPTLSGLDSLPRYVATNPVFLFAVHDLLRHLPTAAGTAMLGVFAALGLVPLLAWMHATGGGVF